MKLSASLAAAAFVFACGDAPSPTEKQTLELERWSPPQASAHDLLLATRGDVVVMGKRISRDGGATWSTIDGRFGELKGVTLTGTTLTVFGTATKLARWNLVTDAVTPIAGAPAYLTERNWRVDPTGSLVVVFDGVENRLAVERNGTWTTGTLPQPAATEVKPYIKDLESNGTTLLSVGAWGVHRSTDGATWTYVGPGGDARDIVVLGDGRFVIVGDGPGRLYDANGNAAGTLPGLATVEETEATVCDDGAIMARNRVTRDLGVTWKDLTADGDLDMQVKAAACAGGRFWMLALSDIWGYRLVRFDNLDSPGIAAGNWSAAGDMAWTSSGPPIARTLDGTFLANGFALAPGATDWTLREAPSKIWANSGDIVFGAQKLAFFTSHDGGLTWVDAAAKGLTIEEPEAFARGSDGSLYVSQMLGTSDGDSTTWHSTVWRSSDSGATWTVAYDASATRSSDGKLSGEAHRFVGLTPDGAWISTDAVSRDGGMTWQKTAVKGDIGLAHLTLAGTLVTGGANEDLWRVYDDGGLGELRATYQIVVDGQPIPASQLRSVAFDAEGYAYVARGAPHVQLWRSNRPLD